ncbi:hypothetical protein MSIMFB_01237 [Mycobacterium simulans]|uniref:Uncharacterized protein n=1 Tax=Mycobacterium simulans TaxID=627089 RepID=A0A7Z7IHV0_9MYCO|nr:hypothetical protein MSIMFB_01237 [Mycobacterium simulans]
MSRGEVVTRPFTDVDNTSHDGHAGAVGSAVTACTTRVPSGKRSTHSTPHTWQPKQQCRSVEHGPWFPFVRLNASQHSDFRRPRASNFTDTPMRAKSQLPAYDSRAAITAWRRPTTTPSLRWPLRHPPTACISSAQRQGRSSSMHCGHSAWSGLLPALPTRSPKPANRWSTRDRQSPAPSGMTTIERRNGSDWVTRECFQVWRSRA